MTKYVYDFHEGNKDMRALLGGKGANLAEMTNIGLSVPPGFTVTTEACIRFLDEGALWDELEEEIRAHIAKIEEVTGKKFSDNENPLLVSVRSGAVISMPGMMDTILNLGLNDQAVEGLAKATNNPRFAYDSYRRFIQMFGDVAMSVPKSLFDYHLEKRKSDKGVANDTDLDAEDLKALVEDYKAVYKDQIGKEFPQDPYDQLFEAVRAVFRSWNNPRANVYRALHGIDHHLGTAVNVQTMAFGNTGDKSGTGVAFSRDPSTGDAGIYGEYLINAQGEDVVAGIRTPQKIATLKEIMPSVYEEFMSGVTKLEAHYRDMQDIEFTIENKKLYFLQCRNGKRTASAAVNVAVDLVEEGVITKEEAIMRVEPKSLDQLLHPTFNPKALEEAKTLANGLPASPGAATGKIYFTAQAAKAAHEKGEAVVLVRQETSPEDIEGMVVAEGIVTARGGMTSHAAVVARGMGKCCVAGCSDMRVDEISKLVYTHDGILHEGDVISLDGSSGKVYLGNVEKQNPSLTGKFQKFMQWADEIRTLGVRTNADTPRDAKQAFEFGAEGVGLCRTEHMFFNKNRIMIVRSMILARDLSRRKEALDRILPLQRGDFYEIFKVMQDRPVNIRLLDPPLHEFLPKKEEEIAEVAKLMGVEEEEIRATIKELEEVNPMMGHRGCRLGVSFPEIYRMQVRAIIEATIMIHDEGGTIAPEIMIPLVGDVDEMRYIKSEISEEIAAVFEMTGKRVPFTIGTMIEIPRAALLADEIAEVADFFSFGTNDLAQMTYGFSRDDAGKFLHDYIDKGIMKHSPFEVLDTKGVGKLVEMAAKLGRSTNPDLHLGVCGEVGGDPESIRFFNKVGLNYVSCSPFRVPIARLAAAQAAVEAKETK